MPIDLEMRRYATIGSVCIGAIMVTTEHEHVAWFGLLGVAILWVAALLATRGTD